MRIKQKLAALTAVLLGTLVLASVVLASILQTPTVDWGVTGSGGGHLEQDNLSLDNTLGQPVVGAVSSGNVELRVGFWYGPEEEAAEVPPVAAFTAAPRQGEPPLSVVFTDTSTYTPTEWLWIFGDSDTAMDQNPTHVYNDPGNYTVTLTVSNTYGSDTLTKTNYITVTAPGCNPLTGVEILGTPTGITDTTYSFIATVSPTNASQPIAYAWSPSPDSGQGTTVVTYTWPTTGTKIISVTTSNCSGTATADDTHAVTIQALPPGTVPVQDVTISGPVTGTVNTAYDFTATVSPPGASTPITYTWSPTPDSGQGTAVVTYTWPTTGTKTITVIAENAGGGNLDSHQVDISISSGYDIYLPLVLRNTS